MGAGPSITWNIDADSPSGSGLKSVVSDAVEIDGFSSEKFWAAFERRARTREAMNYEKAYESTSLPNGGILAVSTYDLPGAGEMKTYSTLMFNPEKDEVEMSYYHSDSTLKSLASLSTLKLYHNPLRMEFWADEKVSRATGPFIRAIVLELVKKMGSGADVAFDVESISEPGAKSVLTGPLDGASVTADGFIDWTKQQLEEKGATVQPDGLWLEETTTWFGPTTYRKHSFDTANNLVITFEYGTDATCSPAGHASTSYTKVHKDPFRLEVWNVTVAARRSGEPVKAIIEKIVEDVLKEYAKDS